MDAEIHDAFVERLIARMSRIQVGDARAVGTTMGPAVDERQLNSNLKYVDTASAEGGRLIFGGERLTLSTRGHYMSPALVTETTAAMTINREEVFGPVASVIRVNGYDEALAVANDTPFGLSAGVCTQSLKHAMQFRRDAQAGQVMINLPTAGVDYHAPFGGRKASSQGPREQGRSASEFYTTVKTTYIGVGAP